MLHKEKKPKFLSHARLVTIGHHSFALTATTPLPCLRASMPYSLPYNCFSLCKAPRHDTPHFEPCAVCAAASNPVENGGLVKSIDKSTQMKKGVQHFKRSNIKGRRGQFFCGGDRKESKVGRLRGDREKNGGLVLVSLVGKFQLDKKGEEWAPV